MSNKKSDMSKQKSNLKIKKPNKWRKLFWKKTLVLQRSLWSHLTRKNKMKVLLSAITTHTTHSEELIKMMRSAHMPLGKKLIKMTKLLSKIYKLLITVQQVKECFQQDNMRPMEITEMCISGKFGAMTNQTKRFSSKLCTEINKTMITINSIRLWVKFIVTPTFIQTAFLDLPVKDLSLQEWRIQHFVRHQLSRN